MFPTLLQGVYKLPPKKVLMALDGENLLKQPTPIGTRNKEDIELLERQ